LFAQIVQITLFYVLFVKRKENIMELNISRRKTQKLKKIAALLS
jgi:hypothetical protein